MFVVSKKDNDEVLHKVSDPDASAGSDDGEGDGEGTVASSNCTLVKVRASLTLGAEKIDETFYHRTRVS